MVWAEKAAEVAALQPQLHVPSSSQSEPPTTLDPAWQRSGAATNSRRSLLTSSWDKGGIGGRWTDVHCLAFLCLIVRGCGATNEEAVDGIISALQYDGICGFDMTDVVQQMLEQIPFPLPTDLSAMRPNASSEEESSTTSSTETSTNAKSLQNYNTTAKMEAVEAERQRLIREQRIFGSLELIASGGMAGVGLSSETMQPTVPTDATRSHSGDSRIAGRISDVEAFGGTGTAADVMNDEGVRNDGEDRWGGEWHGADRHYGSSAPSCDEDATSEPTEPVVLPDRTNEEHPEESRQPNTTRKTLGQTLEVVNPFI